MYNQPLKERFVSEFSKTESMRTSLHVMFEAIGKHEEKYGKDFCQMNVDELNHVLSEVLGYRSNSKRARIAFLHSYSQWCVNNDIPGSCLAILDVDFDSVGLEKIRRQTVASPQHLQRYLDTVFEKEAEDTVDVVYRCFFWLAYMGLMREEDALRVDESDVDLEDMAIRFNGREYPFYREAIPSIKKCMTLKSFRFIHPRYDPIFKPRASGTALLRGFQDNSMSVQVFRSRICMKAKEKKYLLENQKDDKSLDLSLSYDRVWLSGRFFTMLENERAGMSVDFTYLAEEFMEGREYNLSSGRNLITAKRRWLTNDYKKDYERWKQAYSAAR